MFLGGGLPRHAICISGRFGYDDDATEDAWRRVFAFFGEHLG